MVDRTLLLRKLAELEEYLGQLREYSTISTEEYSRDWKVRRIVERTLQIMIEVCIDIAGHIISDRKLRVPPKGIPGKQMLSFAGAIPADDLKVMEQAIQNTESKITL